MTVGDWQGVAAETEPEWLVFFYYDGEAPLPPERYCTGGAVRRSHYWAGRAGWLPCLLVELGEEC